MHQLQREPNNINALYFVSESEGETNNFRANLLKMEEEMKSLKDERIDAERLLCAIQDKLTNCEKEKQKLEEERMAAVALAQAAQAARIETEQDAAKRDCYYQDEFAKMEVEYRSLLKSNEEAHARETNSSEKSPGANDSTVLALLKEVAELKVEKERAQQKIVKRDLKLKDVSRLRYFPGYFPPHLYSFVICRLWYWLKIYRCRTTRSRRNHHMRSRAFALKTCS